MAMKNPPQGYRTITPFFQLKDADRFIDFLKAVFDAEQTELVRRPDGKVGHAEFRIGDSVVMLGEGDPKRLGLYLYLDDVDQVYRKALAAGATSSQEPADQFWGGRQAAALDAWDKHVVDRHTQRGRLAGRATATNGRHGPSVAALGGLWPDDLAQPRRASRKDRREQCP